MLPSDIKTPSANEAPVILNDEWRKEGRSLINREGVRIECTGVGREWQCFCEYSLNELSFKFIIHFPESNRREGNKNDKRTHIHILMPSKNESLIASVKTRLDEIKSNITAILGILPTGAQMGYDPSMPICFNGPIS